MYIYVLLELFTWGISLWTVSYLYVWLILFAAVRLFRKMDSPLGWAVLCGAFGLFFGLFCAPVCFLSGGWAFALNWWLSGIPYDLLHCGGNFAATLVLYRPCRRILSRLYSGF